MKSMVTIRWPAMAGATAALLLGGVLLTACNGKQEGASGEHPAAKAAEAGPSSKGVGPIKSVELGPLNEDLAAQGEKIFSGTCSACHKLDKRYIGPALAGVSHRREPEWIMNMILNPTGMTQNDPTAKALLGEYLTQMSVNMTEAEARAVLEYFRKVDGTQKVDDE